MPGKKTKIISLEDALEEIGKSGEPKTVDENKIRFNDRIKPYLSSLGGNIEKLARNIYYSKIARSFFVLALLAAVIITTGPSVYPRARHGLDVAGETVAHLVDNVQVAMVNREYNQYNNQLLQIENYVQIGDCLRADDLSERLQTSLDPKTDERFVSLLEVVVEYDNTIVDQCKEQVVAATQTAMAVPTNTATPLPTPTPGISYMIISLRNFVEQESSNLGLMAGNYNLLNIPFETGYKVTTQCGDNPNLPVEIPLNISIPNTRRIHLLLQAGWATQEFAGARVGSVELYFNNQLCCHVPLIVGDTIRDWSRDRPGAVGTTTNPALREAWRGPSPYTDTNGQVIYGGMDVLSIGVPEEHFDSTLTTIEIKDTSVETAGSQNPCVHLLAVTVEYVQ